LKAEKKLSVDQGIFVTAALSWLPAMQAWIQNGDIITAVNDKLINANYPFLYHMYTYLPWTTISLSVIRGDQTLTIPVTLGQNVQ
jgi:S1-C subfamily serine protease